MQKLIEFLIGKRHWFLFILCEIVAFTLLFRYNTYQRSVFLSSANAVSGSILSVSSSIVSYVNLRDVNRQLFEQNKQLEVENLNLKLQLRAMKADMLPYDAVMTDSVFHAYEYISAEVVNISVTHLSNYITINKGYKDGIGPDMGVVSTHGVVGIVTTVNARFSVIIPLLHPKSRVSGKLSHGEYFGILSWDGRDAQYANLEELPTHTEFQEGDIVVTSGFSAVFPPGIIVGTVVQSENSRNTGLYSLKVKLATDFQRLTTVRVIKNYYQNEQWEVEQEAKRND